ncbi:thiamine transporter [Bacillus ectoiniformans]|uniref:energy-coupled thiamine transporter ThiT n=1 Tax=Bacillus ectoiniformans TaxID=1494429 RepID=UPI0019588393|nr:energy-coupled thiamine transporter ThiT [Bacillus ectoiniformans]MBM7649278.1 thiamine transporter [Bacillus ectoiniformans]
MRNKLPLQALMEAAIFASLAFLLDLLPSIKLSPVISISFAMVPIFYVALRWGVKAGMASGFLWGLLQVILGDAYILTPVQAFIEYFVAFAFIGMAGVFAGKLAKAEKKAPVILAAVFIGSAARYVWHFLAGWIYFGEYAPEGTPAALYSLFVNGITMLGAFALCSIVMMFLWKAAPRLLTVRA